ncbi:MAG: DUF4886 domain-containing protein [Oscillospiraceae bacterium]|nr:DUF4886 domain-containing protein [Oscillospiraceae bacterium]
MKRILSLCLSLLLLTGILAGCTETAPEQTQPIQQEDETLKILMIGGSLGYDTMYMMPAVAKNEGWTDVSFGILYRSAGLKSLTPYAQSGRPEFAYLEYVVGEDEAWRRAQGNGNFTISVPSEANDKFIEDGSIAVTAEFALQRMDWDIVIIMSSSSEITNVSNDLNMANAEAMMTYVKEHDLNPATTPEFGWHMIWSLPEDSTLWNEARSKFMAQHYNNNAMAMFEDNVKNTQQIVVPALEGKIKYLFPCVAALQNAKSSTVVTDKDIHRDFIHGTDYARLIAAYVWYCELTDTNIRDCKFGPVPNGIVRDNEIRNSGKDYELSEEWKQVLIESVENAIQKPYELTPSAY